MHCTREDLLAITGATAEMVDGWWKAFSRYRASKASRCVASTVKSVDWYCWPVVKDMTERGISIQRFSVNDFEDRQARRNQAGICNSTLRSEFFFTNAMLGVAVRERLIKRNPLVDYTKAPKVKPHVLTPTLAQFGGLPRAVRNRYRPSKTPGAVNLSKQKADFLRARDLAIIVLNARGAMRTCEVFNLRLSDYQPSENRVVVRTAKDREPRYVPIYADSIQVIDAYIKVRPAAETDYLFVSDRGTQITVNWWSKHFRVFAEAAGMAGVTPRAMRHFGITLNAQENLLAASKAVGHSSLTTTKGYLHSDWEHTKAALSRVQHLDLTDAQDGRSRKRII